MFETLICAIKNHRYVVEKRFSATTRKVGCTRCNKKWAMNDSVKAFLPLDSDFEQLHENQELKEVCNGYKSN